MIGTAAVVVLAVVAFAIFQPIQVLPRIRLAPGFALVDQSGATVTSEDARGAVTLYTFAYAACDEECDAINATMREVRDRVAGEVDFGDTPFRQVTISFDPERDTPEALAVAAAGSGADGDSWLWASPDPSLLTTVVGAGFKAWYEPQPDGSFRFDPLFVLVDGWGVVRGEYRYQTVAGEADKIVRHAGLLAEELRNSSGVASLAYEAAHVFLCYP
ncbi:MAG: SCO family protein [Acidimicrobiia bacterium]